MKIDLGKGLSSGSTSRGGVSPMKRNALLAVVLCVVAFFWIWLSGYIGAPAYWVALVAFAVCLASGPAMSSLPGLTAAYRLSQAGVGVTVLERHPTLIGGISRR